MGIASTLLAFLDAGVFSYTYPVLIRCFQNGHTQEFKRHLSKMFVLTVATCVAFSLVSLLILPHLLQWIRNDFYLAHQNLYGWVLFVMVINAIGLVPHYALYAQGRDQPIIVSHLAGLVTFIAVTWLASHVVPLISVPLGMAAAFSVIFLWKGICFLGNAKARLATINE